MPPFKFNPAYTPIADQPQAIDELAEGLAAGEQFQTLLGVTGSGKTFTMGNVIEKVQRPTLVLAHNKTLAAQLCSEFREFFPDNAVEYFVSYYDYYQPEAYVPHQDLYIEKDSSINDEIDRLRHSATAALFARARRDHRRLGLVRSTASARRRSTSEKMLLLKVGEWIDRDATLRQLVSMQYTRNDTNLTRGTFRVRGDVLEIHPGLRGDAPTGSSSSATRSSAIQQFDPLTGEIYRRPRPHRHLPGEPLRRPRRTRSSARSTRSSTSSNERCTRARGSRASCSRRTACGSAPSTTWRCCKEMGYCSGIENYSRILDGAARRARRRTR